MSFPEFTPGFNVTVTLSDEEMDFLEKESAGRGIAQNDLINEMVLAYLQPRHPGVTPANEKYSTLLAETELEAHLHPDPEVERLNSEILSDAIRHYRRNRV